MLHVYGRFMYIYCLYVRFNVGIQFIHEACRIIAISPHVPAMLCKFTRLVPHPMPCFVSGKLCFWWMLHQVEGLIWENKWGNSQCRFPDFQIKSRIMTFFLNDFNDFPSFGFDDSDGKIKLLPFSPWPGLVDSGTPWLDASPNGGHGAPGFRWIRNLVVQWPWESSYKGEAGNVCQQVLAIWICVSLLPNKIITWWLQLFLCSHLFGWQPFQFA